MEEQRYGTITLKPEHLLGHDSLVICTALGIDFMALHNTMVGQKFDLVDVHESFAATGIIVLKNGDKEFRIGILPSPNELKEARNAQ